MVSEKGRGSRRENGEECGWGFDNSQRRGRGRTEGNVGCLPLWEGECWKKGKRKK